MELLSLFQDKLKTEETASEHYAQKWDERAERFYDAQKEGRKDLQEAVVDFLKQKEIITKDSTVLDIGAGAGRYTVPLAKEVKHIYGTDFSKNMVTYLERIKKEEAITNMTTRQLAWPTTEEVEPVDVVFSAMCPCTRSRKALEQISEVANEYGVIAQMTKMSDDITDELIAKGQVKRNPKDPHNNRDLALSYFGLLWELGFEPEINFIVDSYEAKMTEEDAWEHYQQRYEHVDEKLLKDTIEKRVEKDQVKIQRMTRLALITWATKVK